MPSPGVNYPVKLAVRSELKTGARPRAEKLGQTVSGLLAILVWNDNLRPNRSLEPLANPERVTRVDLTVSLRAGIRTLAERTACSREMTLNSYLEALLAADLMAPDRDLVILASP